MNALLTPLPRELVRANWLESLPPSADCLRAYQRTQVGEVAHALASGCRRILVQLPTGGGKTHELAAITAAAVDADLRVLFAATRTRLVRQASARFDEFGIRHGIIAAAVPGVNYSAPVQVASVDTLHRRAMVARTMPMPLADVVIFDEAHLATTPSRLAILDSYPQAVRIGFTATPARKSGLGLGRAFDRLILGPSIRELQHAGQLVPLRIYSTPLVTAAELTEIPRDNSSDYATEALGELLARPKLVGDVVANWLRIANGKRTMVFAVHKAHAAALVTDFLRNGVSAELLTDQDDENTREQVMARLEDGSTRVVVNCFLLSYGVDIPSVECIVLARPTRSLPMYLQMCGRGLRPSPETGKTDCILIDHGRVVETLGLPQSDFPWTLDEGRNVNAEAVKAQAARIATEASRHCPECSAVWLTSEDGHACPVCGWMPAPRAKQIVASDADLQELADRPNRIRAADSVVLQFHREALGWYSTRWPDRWHQKPKAARWWAWMQAVEHFELTEARPPVAFWNHAPTVPSQDVGGWLLSRQIRWARSKARSAA